MIDSEWERGEFAAAMGKTAIATSGKAPDAIKLNVYFEKLIDIPLYIVTAALDECAKQSSKFPSVQDIRAMADACLDFKLVPPEIEAAAKKPKAIAGTVMDRDGKMVTTYYCWTCQDQGWITKTCPAEPCGRTFCVGSRKDEHGQPLGSHTYVTRCRETPAALNHQCCFPNNPIAYRELQKADENKRYSKKFSDRRKD